MLNKILKTAALSALMVGAVQAAEIEVKIVNNTGSKFLYTTFGSNTCT